MAYDQEVLGSNPVTIYWMDASDDASYYIKRKLKIKEAKWGTPKKKVSYLILKYFFGVPDLVTFIFNFSVML
jgi:hypothetical protein